MSDQMFTGIAPKSDAGKEYFFVCMDDWADVYQCIANLVIEDFPSQPILDDKSATLIAGRINELIADGQCKELYEWLTREQGVFKTAKSRASRVADLLALTKDFAEFLNASGGCRPE